MYDMFADQYAVRNDDDITAQRIDITSTQHYKSASANTWDGVTKVGVEGLIRQQPFHFVMKTERVIC